MEEEDAEVEEAPTIEIKEGCVVESMARTRENRQEAHDEEGDEAGGNKRVR